MDIPIHQILIKARIVSIDERNLRSLGILFGTESKPTDLDDGLSLDIPDSSLVLGAAHIPIVKLQNGQLLDLTPCSSGARRSRTHYLKP